MDFYFLLKKLVKTSVVSIVKNFLIMLKYLSQIHLKLLQREQCKKQQKHNEITDKITNTSSQSVLKTNTIHKQKIKYQEKYIYIYIYVYFCRNFRWK